MAQSVLLRKMTEICLSLPDTKLTMTWGSPHFRVGDKIFAGCGEENGKASTGFKASSFLSLRWRTRSLQTCASN